MGKRSQKRLLHYERDQLGCMRSFISLFNFHPGRAAQKLLVDWRLGSKPSTVVGSPRNKLDKSSYSNKTSQEAVDEGRNVGVDVSNPSVKKLIEEEMFTDQGIKKEVIDGELGHLSDSELDGQRKKNQRRKNRTHKRSCDNFSHINVVDQPESEVHRNSKHQSSRSLDIDNMIEEFCCEIHQRNTNRVKHDVYKEKLSELIKFLTSQKLLHGNGPIKDDKIFTSEALMEVFQILGSDEELFLKLLQDPDLLVLGDVQDLQNDQREKVEENPPSIQNSNKAEQFDVRVGRKQRGFFRRKNKSLERINQASDRIVILKPGPASLLSPETTNSHGSSPKSHSTRKKGQNERIYSHFFLAEIKRKLKHAIGKEQRRAPSDGGIKEGFRKSMPTKDHFFIERMSRRSTDEKEGINCENGYSKERLSNIYNEAKKHLSEMLSKGDADPKFSGKQDPKTLGRILSLPEYLSPFDSPGIKQELISSLSVHKTSAFEELKSDDGNKKETLARPLGQITPNSNDQPCISDDGSDYFVEPLQPVLSNSVEENANRGDETSSRDGNTSTGNAEIVKAIEIIVQEENRASNVSSEQCTSSMTGRDQTDDDAPEECNGERHDEVFKLDFSSEESLSHSPIENEECQAGTSDLLERSSPISVLDPLLSEDDISPARIRSPSVEPQVQPLCIRFEENDESAENQGSSMKTNTDEKELIFDYMETVLDALNLNWEELYLKSLSSDQLLEPSLINEVQFFPNQMCFDHELLFDCINEVLLEFCGHQYGCSPWVSSLTPKIRHISDMKNIIHEVQEGVYMNLLPLPLPRTLDQIVGKDMAIAGNWMDFRFDVDSIGVDMSEVILDELLEEIILQMNRRKKGDINLNL